MSPRTVLRRLCCVTWASMLNICLDDADLRELGHWPTATTLDDLSAGVRARASLCRACHADDDELERLRDHLDLRYLDTVLAVRDLPDDELQALERSWCAEPDGRSLPGLIWALCSDERCEAHGRGVRLCHEALTLSARQFVHSTPSS